MRKDIGNGQSDDIIIEVGTAGRPADCHARRPPTLIDLDHRLVHRYLHAIYLIKDANGSPTVVLTGLPDWSRRRQQPSAGG